MSKRKRSPEEKLEYYRHKIRKYELREGGPSDIPNTDSPTGFSPYPDEYEQQNQDENLTGDPTQDVQDNNSEDSYESSVTDLPEAQTSNEAETQLETEKSNTENTTSLPVPDVPSQENPVSLDPELLEALGESTDGEPEFGEKIHDNLAQLWLPLLKKGLVKESKEKLTKDYLIPENCKLLQAPKLNAEIAKSSAISELGRNRDKKMVSSQQQLGAGITAINRAMTILLGSDNKIKAIKCLSDSCRILCDLHYQQTHYRKKLITSSLDKSFCQVIQDVDRDETLFGTDLSEKIKISKTIERQGLQIKKPSNNPKPSTSQSTANRPATGSGNWAGHSRSTNRGGGRGGRRGSLAYNQMQFSAPRGPPPPPPSAQAPHPYTSRARPPPQQRR